MYHTTTKPPKKTYSIQSTAVLQKHCVRFHFIVLPWLSVSQGSCESHYAVVTQLGKKE